MIKAIIFDWGDTVMRDFPEYSGPMCDWLRVELMPGIREVLTELHGKVPLYLATNAGDSDAVRVARALERVGLETYFDKIFTSRELGFAKPALGFFELSYQLGVAPRECLMVGNDHNKDILPAREAGMQAVWCNSETAGEKLFAEIRRVVDDSLTKELQELEDRMLQPEFRQSVLEIEKLLADDFIEFGSSGRIYTKRQELDELPLETTTEWTLGNFKLNILASDVALVTYRAYRSGGENHRGTASLRSSIWKLNQGQWQIVFHQGTPSDGTDG